MTVLTITRHEINTYFRSPLAWVVVAGCSFICGWIFLWYVQSFLQIQAHLATIPGAQGVTGTVVMPVLLWSTLILLLLTPLLSMRLIAGERRSGTLPLLRAAPVSSLAIIVGKYLAVVLFLWIQAFIIVLMPLTLELGTHLDLGQFAAGIVALALATATFPAICLFMSCVTQSPTLAATGSYGILVLLWIFHLAASGAQESILTYLSFGQHFLPMLRGVFNTANLAYFVIIIAFFIILSIWRLDSERLSG